MITTKVTTVGSSVGIILTKEMQIRLKVKKGDTLYFTESPDGSFRVSAYDPDFAYQMAIAEEIMNQDRDILRALAH